MEYLFVYGTLLSTFNNPWSKLLFNRSIFSGAGKIHGVLFDLGEYPGAVSSIKKSSLIYGEIYAVSENTEELFAKLDAYEGEEYLRTKTNIYLKDKMVSGWFYEYIGTQSGKIRISSGDYQAYLNGKFSG